MMAYSENKLQHNHVEEVKISFVYKQSNYSGHSFEVSGNIAYSLTYISAGPAQRLLWLVGVGECLFPVMDTLF